MHVNFDLLRLQQRIMHLIVALVKPEWPEVAQGVVVALVAAASTVVFRHRRRGARRPKRALGAQREDAAFGVRHGRKIQLGQRRNDPDHRRAVVFRVVQGVAVEHEVLQVRAEGANRLDLLPI